MPTMSQAIREALQHYGGHASRDQIRAFVDQKYPDEWEPSTLTMHFYGFHTSRATGDAPRTKHHEPDQETSTKHQAPTNLLSGQG